MSAKRHRSICRPLASKALFIVWAALSISGCATNAVVYSEKHVENAAKVTAFDVYYVERNLITSARGSQADSSPVNRTIAKFGYFEVGPKLVEFGPPMFRRNGLTGTFKQMPSSDFLASTLVKPEKATGSLVLEFRQGRVVTQGAAQSLSLMQNATLYDFSGRSRIWSAQFSSHLGNDPALGVLKTTRVDQAYVEGLLAMVLEQMSKDQLIVLRNGKALQPGAPKQ